MKRRNFLLAGAASVAATALPIKLKAGQHYAGRSFPIIKLDENRRIVNVDEIFANSQYVDTSVPGTIVKAPIRYAWAWLRREDAVPGFNLDGRLILQFGLVKLSQIKYGVDPIVLIVDKSFCESEKTGTFFNLAKMHSEK